MQTWQIMTYESKLVLSVCFITVYLINIVKIVNYTKVKNNNIQLYILLRKFITEIPYSFLHFIYEGHILFLIVIAKDSSKQKDI